MNNINEEPSRKPKDSNFHQQKLPSWNPLILINTSFPFFGIIGFAFIIIGTGLLLSSISVKEYQLDYTNCNEFNSDTNSYTGRSCSNVLDRNLTKDYFTCTCKMNFSLPTNYKGQVYFYYLLQNLYQNHRKYFGSRDNNQLLGKPSVHVSDNCEPFSYIKTNDTYLNYAPCGLIANSIFNDSFQLVYINNKTYFPVNMSSKGIAWKSDRDLLFGIPQDWKDTMKPVHWPETAKERNINSYKGDEELMVWMRTAPLSTFKKLNRIVQHVEEPFKDGLPAGYYELNINYSYPVSVFKGKKMIFLSTTSLMGGKNNNLGIMYISLGCLHELIALVFFVFAMAKKDKETSFSDTPLIMSPLTPESYGVKELRLKGSDVE